MNWHQKSVLITLLVIFQSSQLHGQGLKDKMAGKLSKDNSAQFECGYKHVAGLKEKANPMRALQKGLGGAATKGSNPDLGTAAISVFYQAHLHPETIMRYPTQIKGWETCGDAVFLGFTNKGGVGLSSTDGVVKLSDQKLQTEEEIPYSGIGTYFLGFSPDKRGQKRVEISSSNGDKVDLELQPGLPLEIKTINGVPKGGDVSIDGTQDVTIEVDGGDDDPASYLHVQLVCKLVGTPIIYDVTVTRAKNTIIIPKEAFKNFEGSPSPFIKKNTLIVNRVTEKVINHTPVGALRTISAYMDWMQVTLGGDLVKGNVLTMGFDSTKNTDIKIDLVTKGEYAYVVKKGGPYIAPPVNLMKNVAVASFVVRGNLSDKKITSGDGWIMETTKWFPEMSDQTWQALVDKLYARLEVQLKQNHGLHLVPLANVVSTEAYKHIKPIQDGATQNFVEVGAGGTQRILTTRPVDVFKDLTISFPGDFISQRLVQELNVDAVLAITIDLNFNFETEGLDPVVQIEAFAPNVSYKTAASYFTMTASTSAKSLDHSRKFTGSVDQVIYQMIKGDALVTGFSEALNQLSREEQAYPVYEKLWQTKL